MSNNNLTDSDTAPPKNTTKTALTIAVTSGKGGVGKTNVTTNLGIALAKSGKRVCVFDADTSLANINILLNLHPQYTLEHFLRERLTIEDIMLTGPENLKIIPAATGIADFVQFKPQQQRKFIAALEDLEQTFDYLLIDTAAGIGDAVIQFIQAAQYAVVIISPEPTSLTDAFSLIKVLMRKGYEQPVYVLVNMTQNYQHSMAIYKRFAQAVNKYIGIKVRYLGYIPTDIAVQQAVQAQTPVTISAVDSPAGRCFHLLARILAKHFTPNKAAIKKISDFWREQAQPVDTDTPKVADVSESSHLPPSQHPPLVLDPHMTQQQADTLLSDLIQFYLGEFGTLPGQAINLILQAFAQEQLSEENIAQLRQQIFEDEGHRDSAVDAAPCPAQHIEQQIDTLASQADQSKQQLTKLALHLQQKYRELYNRDIFTPPPRLITAPNNSTIKTPQKKTPEEEQQMLLRSAWYAAAADHGSE